MINLVIRKTILGNANGCFLLRPRLFLRLITIPRELSESFATDISKWSTQPKHADLLSQNKRISHLIRTGQMSQAREAFDNMKQRDTVTWNSMVTGYVKRGEIENARKLFDEMPERNVVSWNVMIWGYTSCSGRGYIEEARSLFYEMPRTDSISWSTMISGFMKNGRIGEALKLFNTMPEKSVGSWNAMITGFLQNGDLVSAIDFFERMPNRNVRSWTAMINGYANIGKMSEALKLFNRMPERDAVSWSAMITGFLRNGDVVRAIEFFERMPQRNANCLGALVSGLIQNGELDEATRIAHECRNREVSMEGLVQAYNTLIAGYGEKGRVEEARHLFDQIPLCHNKGNNGRRFERNIVSWNSMILCYVKAKNVVSARKLFDQMVYRNTISWNTMISGYVRVSNMQEASNLFCKMPNPNTASWTAMVSGYAQLGCLELAHDYFEKMPQKVLTCWNSMIVGYEKKGDFRGAVKLFSQMRLEGEKPDRYTILSILKVCSGLVNLHLGMQIHQLVTKTVVADMPINTSLIIMYSRCGAVKEAETIFDHVKVQKDVITWNAMIGTYGSHGFAAEALELLTLMKSLNVQPTYGTFMAVLNACTHAGLVEDGQNRMQQYAFLVDIIGRHGHLEEAMHLINSMPFKPDKAVWEALLGACRVHNNIELAKVAAVALTRLEPESSAPYELLYNMYTDAGLWDEAEALKSLIG